MKQLVAELLTASGQPTACLQRINEALLKAYQLTVPSVLTLYPKEVEIYYVNLSARPPYIDANMHCRLDPKSDADIWRLQSARYGRLYIHRKGLGGMDICLSNRSDYALCSTIKAAEIDGVVYWSPLRVRNALLDACCRSIGEEPTKEHRQQWADRLNAPDSPIVLQPREYPLEGDVYHLRRRGLRRRDNNLRLPLRSFMDLWHKQMPMGNVQKILLYMNQHPAEDVLEVLRRHEFRYIPAEIRARYKIDRKVRLYEES